MGKLAIIILGAGLLMVALSEASLAADPPKKIQSGVPVTGAATLTNAMGAPTGNTPLSAAVTKRPTVKAGARAPRGVMHPAVQHQN